MSVDLLHGHQMGNRLDHAANLRPVLARRGVADPLPPSRPQGVPLVLLAADGTSDLANLQLRHHELTASRARNKAAGATSSTALPRRFATASGCSRLCSAATVACTTLMALGEPSDFANTSRTPAHSSTARAEPPAITPVPGEAGRNSTTPAAFSPCTGCGMVP